ncbi:hypothetical protein NDU88_005547 [Pleurodeles waltl]|uniref:Uncharacterized protein n=1 Tax=Pleurodeles waltl TaxID=8319 RepID=A0AAV7M9M6_PLEWA|nr:hypothetical protein NDU88_005547 [Pleurodeles waltl]
MNRFTLDTIRHILLHQQQSSNSTGIIQATHIAFKRMKRCRRWHTYNLLAPEGPVIIRIKRTGPGAIGAGAAEETWGNLSRGRGALSGPYYAVPDRVGELLSLRLAPRPEPGTRVKERAGAGVRLNRVRLKRHSTSVSRNRDRGANPLGATGAVDGLEGRERLHLTKNPETSRE